MWGERKYEVVRRWGREGKLGGVGDGWCVGVLGEGSNINRKVFFFFKQKTAYEMIW